MNEWILRIALPLVSLISMFLFACFVPNDGNLGTAGKAVYRKLVKLVILEAKMKTRVRERFSAC